MKREYRKISFKGTEAERTKRWRKEFPERARLTDRKARLKNVFGITEEQYEELLNKQEHRCAICLKHKTEFKKRLHIDHNHKSGEIRGLLCAFCNRRVVGRHTNADLFDRAANYLRQGTGWLVPQRKKKRRK